MTKVTVVLPAHAEKKYLDLAIRSIQNQDLADWLLFLVLDNADLETKEIAYQAGEHDDRITIFERSYGNLGAVLEDICSLVETEYIVRMDADDFAYSDRMQTQIAFMEGRPDVVVSGTNVRFIDEKGFPFNRSANKVLHSEIYEELLRGRGGAIFHPTAIIRTSALRECGGYSSEFKRGQDLDVYLRLCEIGSLANIENVCLDFRKHKKSSTADECIKEAFNRRVATINNHLCRIQKPLVKESDVINLQHRSIEFENVLRLYFSIKNKFFLSGIRYLSKVLSSPKSVQIVFRKVLMKLFCKSS